MSYTKTDNTTKLKYLFNNAFSYTSLYETADRNYYESLENLHSVVSNYSKKIKINNEINKCYCNEISGIYKYCNKCNNEKNDEYTAILDKQVKNEILNNFNRYTVLIYVRSLATKTNMLAINYNNLYLKNNYYSHNNTTI